MQKSEILKEVFMISLVGSRAYGTHTDESDEDFKGLFIAPQKYYLGFSNIEQSQDFDGMVFSSYSDDIPLTRDTEVFELRRFFNLAIANNPNILDILYSPKVYPTAGQGNRLMVELITNRHVFLSKKSKFSFSGYATSQLKKIEMHRKWLLNPPEKEPTLEDFHIPHGYEVSKTDLYPFFEYLFLLMNLRIDFCEDSEILRSEFINLLKENVDYKQILRTTLLPEKVLEYTEEMVGVQRDFTILLQRMKAYLNAKDKWNSYQEWKKHRNQKRSHYEQLVGYDTKHAMHCIRLLRMGCEILEGKEVIVDRRLAGDAEELKNIRFGKVSYNDLMASVQVEEKRLEQAAFTSKLPKSPPIADLETLCCQMVSQRRFYSMLS